MKHFTLLTIALMAIFLSCKEDADPAVPNTYSITVNIADPEFTPLQSFEFVLLKNDQPVANGSGTSFTFTDLEEGQHYTVIPQPQAPGHEGMSTLDFFKIEGFINQEIQLTPFEQLAADVNLDNAVTVVDLEIVRTCILAKENCPGWRYATTDYDGAGNGSADKAEFHNLFANQEVTFKVFKLGDINCTIGPC